MIFLPAIIVVGLYFSKRRAIATGIATSGSGVGTFAYAYLCDHLLRIFSWRQTILILTGILLNCLACGMIFRPLVPVRRKRKSCKGDKPSCKGGGSSSSDCSTYYEHEFEEGETSSMVKKSSGTGSGNVLVKSEACDGPEWLHRSDMGLAEAGKKHKDGNSPLAFCLHPQQLRNSRHRHHRQHHHHHHKHLNGSTIHEPHGSDACNEGTVFLPPSLVPDQRLYRSVEDFYTRKVRPLNSDLDEKILYFSETQLAPESPIKEAPRELEKGQITLGLMRPILRKDIYYSGSVSHLAEYQQCGRSMTSFLAHMTQPESDDSGYSVTTSEEGKQMGHVRRKCAKWMRSVVNPDLFRNKAFLCLLVTFTMWTGKKRCVVTAIVRFGNSWLPVFQFRNSFILHFFSRLKQFVLLSYRSETL